MWGSRQNSSHCIEEEDPSAAATAMSASAPLPLRSEEELAAEEGAVAVCGGDGGSPCSSTAVFSAPQDDASVIVVV